VMFTGDTSHFCGSCNGCTTQWPGVALENRLTTTRTQLCCSHIVHTARWPTERMEPLVQRRHAPHPLNSVCFELCRYSPVLIITAHTVGGEPVPPNSLDALPLLLLILLILRVLVLLQLDHAGFCKTALKHCLLEVIAGT